MFNYIEVVLDILIQVDRARQLREFYSTLLDLGELVAGIFVHVDWSNQILDLVHAGHNLGKGIFAGILLHVHRTVETSNGVHALQELGVVMSGFSSNINRTVHVLQRLSVFFNLVEVVLERVILKDGVGYIFDPLSSLLDYIEAVLCVVVDVDWSIYLLESVQVLVYNIEVMFVVLIETDRVGDILQPLKILDELRVLMTGILIQVDRA